MYSQLQAYDTMVGEKDFSYQAANSIVVAIAIFKEPMSEFVVHDPLDLIMVNCRDGFNKKYRLVCVETACGLSTSSSDDAKERSASMRKLCFVVVLCILFMSIEVVGGIKANSLAILTNATHLLTDVAAFSISMLSLWASSWEANPRQSYGFFRIEILGALVSIQLIWLLTGILVYEAITRLIQQTNDDVDGSYTPKMLRSILDVLMESTPREIDAKQLEKGLMEIEEVVSVHELHIWAITVGKVLFSCHVKIKQEANDAMVLNKVTDYIWREYSISHVTIQIER
ncbi:hypothetical protein YC2023_051833 [Brassica napus]